MIVHRCQQNTTEWRQLRAGVVTASEFHEIMTPLFKPKKTDGVKSYLAMKVAEKWLGGPLPNDTTFAMDQGKLLEERAIPYVTLQTGLEVERVGFVTTDDGLVGCSPDGLIGDGSGLEVKCPEAKAHVRNLIEGKLPKQYAPQVYGSMYVTGRAEWMFLSYRPGFPQMLLTVKRDEVIMQKIERALVPFLVQLDGAFEKLVRANGGKRPPKKKLYTEPSWVSEPLPHAPLRTASNSSGIEAMCGVNNL